MTTVTSTQAILADARVNYAREQTQQADLTGAKINANPTEADLIANDASLQAALQAAEDAATTASSSGAIGGAHGSSSGTPASGGGITAAKAAPDTSAVSAAVNGVDVTA